MKLNIWSPMLPAPAHPTDITDDNNTIRDTVCTKIPHRVTVTEMTFKMQLCTFLELRSNALVF